MSQITIDEFQSALSRHSSAKGEVFPSALGLIEAEEHWSGRLWDVARVVMAEQERMRYLAGGNRPEEVADCVARWSDSPLSVDDIQMAVDCGGYDPDPFEALAQAGRLHALLYHDGSVRIIHGERAGAWISDQMALAAEADVLPRLLDAIGADDVSAPLETTLRAPFEAAESAVRQALAGEGFGVLTEIDVAGVLKAKLGIERPALKILGACNPVLANQALQLDPGLALVLPCNVVVEDAGDGMTRVAIADPKQMLSGAGAPDAELDRLGEEAALRLRRVVTLLRETSGEPESVISGAAPAQAV
jgi:uncharacterized protein (DUF302 family)